MVELLKSNISKWNEWRWRNTSSSIDLSGVNLSGVDLTGANLSLVNFRDANLIGTDLYKTSLEKTDFSMAKLMKSHLRRADLSESDFTGADLTRTDFTETKLSNAIFVRANLTETELIRANLYGVNLKGANLRGSIFFDTTINSVDLSKTSGLTEAKHLGASFLDKQTLERSQGNIPKDFLRACGFQEWELEYIRLYNTGLTPDEITKICYRIAELRGPQVIQYFSIFISHSVADKAFADRLYNDLQNRGIRCWYAPEDIQGGKMLHEQIFTAITRHDKFLIILSEASMKSRWVITEIQRARREERATGIRKLIFISLVPFDAIRKWECFDADTGKDLAIIAREYFIPDFTNWETDQNKYQKAFERLVRDLSSE